MTDDAVRISITIKVEDVVMEIQEKVPLEAVEECVHSMTTGLGQQVLHGVIQVLDDRIARQVPAGWRNVGTEMRWMVSSLGTAEIFNRLDTKPDALLEPFLTLFHDEDVSVRGQAVQWLSYSGKPAVVAAMLTEIQDDDPINRQNAVDVLRNFGAQAAPAVPILIALLRDASPEMRTAAASSLRELGDVAKPALPELITASLTETDYSAYASEIHAIGLLSTKEDTLPLLQKAMAGSLEKIRLAAINILGNYQGVPGAVELLASALGDPDLYIRRTVLSGLSAYGAEALPALPVLLSAAQKETDYDSFYAEMQVIARLSSKVETLLLIKQALGSNLSGIRLAACRTLATYAGVAGAVDAILPALNDKDESVRKCAADGLAQIGGQAAAALPELIKTAQNETDPDMFKSEMDSISAVSDKATALPVLQMVLAGNRVKIRVAACQILGSYQNIPGARESLLLALKDAEPSVRQASASALAAYSTDSGSILPRLTEVASKEINADAFQTEAGAIATLSSKAETLPLLQEAFQRNLAEIRKGVCMALEDYKGVPGAVELLITALDDPQDFVRENAIAALEHYGAEAKPAVPKLITLLGNPGDYYMYIGAAITLGTIGPEASPAVPALISMLQTAKTFDKSYAAYGLQGIGPPARAAVPVLMQYLNKEDSTTNGIMLVKDCIEALKAITLEDFGSDIQKWNAWWALNQATW